MEICRLEHINKNYRMGELVTPLRDISLTVNEGDFIAVEGPSGTGKSTLLYVMATLLAYDGGILTMMGRDVSSLSDTEKTSLRAGSIGFLFQDTNLIQALNVRENLIFAQTVGGREKADRAKADAFLAELGLSDRAAFFPHQLSGGQRRRAMAARALIHAPKLILADEPTNDLDEDWAGRVIGLLRAAADGGAGVVMVTHNSRFAGKANRHFALEDGVLRTLTESIEKRP